MNVTEYIRPASLDDVLATLAVRGPEALLIAGGTDLLPVMRKTRYAERAASDGDGSPRVLVDVGGLDDIKGIAEEDGRLRVGGATSIAAIAASPLIKEKAPVLAAAALSIGSPLVRNRATLGGNLATASPSADTAPALLALDAVIRTTGARGGVREVPISDFFVGYRSTALGDGDVITDVLIPVTSPRSGGRFEKIGLRNADAISVVCVATMLEMDAGTCVKARVALGAVAPVPVRARAVEEALEGRKVDAAAAKSCARLVHEHIAPIDDVRGSGAYRGWVAEAIVARTVMEIAGIEDES